MDRWWVGIRTKVQSLGNIFWITSTRAYPACYFSLPLPPNLSLFLCLSHYRVRSSLKIFRRASDEATGTNKPGHLRVNE